MRVSHRTIEARGRQARSSRPPWVATVGAWGLLAAALTLSGCAADGEIDQPAPLYGEVPIDYPLQLWDQDMEGETLLRVRVTDTGGVDSVEVMESSGHAAFDSAAVAGARDLRFSPARRDGKRIRVWAKVPVHFSKRPRPDTLGV